MRTLERGGYQIAEVFNVGPDIYDLIVLICNSISWICKYGKKNYLHLLDFFKAFR